MSIGNLKTEGNKGNNFPYQLRTLQLLDAINNSINTLPGVDYETRTTTYEAIAPGTGYATGNIIVRYDIIDVATSTVSATVWFNQTTQTTITPAPLAANLVPINAPSGVTVLNGPLTAAVNIQDGGNSITVDSNGATRTTNLLRVTLASGTVAAGTYGASFASVGTANATVKGITLKPGETINFNPGGINNVLDAIAYDASPANAELLIIYLT